MFGCCIFCSLEANELSDDQILLVLGAIASCKSVKNVNLDGRMIKHNLI